MRDRHWTFFQSTHPEHSVLFDVFRYDIWIYRVPDAEVRLVERDTLGEPADPKSPVFRRGRCGNAGHRRLSRLCALLPRQGAVQQCSYVHCRSALRAKVQLGTRHRALPGGATSKRLDLAPLTSGAAWRCHVFCPQLYCSTFDFGQNFDTGLFVDQYDFNFQKQIFFSFF